MITGLKQQAVSQQVEYLQAQAAAKHKEGQTEVAISLYLKSLELDENQPAWVYGNVITLLAQVGRVEQGLSLREQSLKIHPNSDEIYRAIGLSFKQQGNFQNSIDCYLKSLEINEDQPNWAYASLIEMLVDSNQYQQAIDIAHLGIKFHGNFAWINYHLAEAFAALENWQEALYYYNKTSQIKPQPPNIQAKINLAIERQKKTDHKSLDEKSPEKQQDILNCIQKYQEAIQLEPMQPDWLYLNLADKLLQNEEIEEAAKISYQGVQIYPNCYPLHYILGQAFAAQEKWEQAISSYRRVQELNPNWLEIGDRLNQAIFKNSYIERLGNKHHHYSLEIEPTNKTVEKTSNNLENFNDFELNLLFTKLKKGKLNVTSCKSLWNNFQGDKLSLKYGCWLTPSIIYLEATVDGCWITNETTILACSDLNYGVAKANFFQISDQEVAAVACFARNIAREDYESYRICVNYNNNPVVITGEISQKLYSLEFIKHLQSKTDNQKHRIRENLSTSIINLIPPALKPDVGNLLNKLQCFLHFPPLNYVDPQIPFKICVDYTIPLKYDGLFISGWLQDSYDMLEEIIAISALGFEMRLSKQDLYYFERQDVNEFLRNTRYGEFEGEFGFCAYALVPEPIRESIQDCAELHSFRFLVRLKGNIEIDIIPDLKYSDFYNARRRVMKIISPDKVSESMLANCIGPAALKLQQLFIGQVRIKDVILIGTPVEQPLVSLIIPLYRRLDFMKVQLATMANDPAIKQCEIIYVLDSPEQEQECRTFLLNHCTLYQLPVKLVVMEGNSGYAAANNAGASQATGKYLLLLNSDVFAQTKGWVLKMAEFYASSPKIGALGAKLIYEDGSLQHAGMFFAQTTFPFWLTLHYYKGLPGNYQPAQKTRAVPAVTGACLMIRKDLYDQVGGMTTDYVIGDFEDSDLCLKCRELGYESWYFADATLYHLERQSVPLNTVYNGSIAWRLNGRLHQERWGRQIAELMSSHKNSL